MNQSENRSKRFFESLKNNIQDYLGFIDPEKYNIDTCRSVTLQVTNQCNLACTYCYQHNKNACNLKLEDAKKFIDNLLDNKYKQYFDVDKVEFIIFDFIGGEPFLAIDLISDITAYIESQLIKRRSKYMYNHVYSITSNGTLYFDEKVQKYLNTYQNLVNVSVTVDGDKNVHDSCRIYADTGLGSYDDAHAAAIHLKKKYNQKNTKITLAPGNIEHLAESFKYFYNEGYTSINMNCVYENVWNDSKVIKLLYDQTKNIVDWILDNDIDVQCSYFDTIFKNIDEDTKNWCGGVGSMFCIAPNGNLYPCQRYSEISIPTESQSPFIVGTLEHGVCYTEKEQRNNDSFDGVTAWSCADEECRNCPIASACGYCSAYNYETYGTVNKRTKFHCNTHRVRYLVTYYYQQSYKLKTGKDFGYNMDPKLLLDDDMIINLIGEDEFKILKELESKCLN